MTGSDAPTPSVPEAARAGASDCFTVRKRWCWPVMGILSLLCVPEPGLTASGMLDFLEVDTSRREPEIHIHFTQPVIYLSHTPGNVAGEFQVQLRAADPPILRLTCWDAGVSTGNLRLNCLCVVSSS